MTMSRAASTRTTSDLGSGRKGRRSPVPGGPWWWLGAATVALAVTFSALSFAPALARHDSAGYLVSGVLMTASDVLLLVGVVALGGAAASGHGRLRAVSFVLAVIGSAGSVVAEALLRVDFHLGTMAFSVVGPAQALGFLGLGLALARAGRWRSWRRFSLLVLGAYVPLVLVPVLAASGGQNLWALAGFHALVLLVGLAWLTETRSVQDRDVVEGAMNA
jgi:hypothetical protein